MKDIGGLIKLMEYRAQQARDQVEWDETPEGKTAVLLATTADQEDVTHVMAAWMAELTAMKLVDLHPNKFIFLQARDNAV